MMNDIQFNPQQENEEQYIFRICSMKDSSGMTWQEIADIINEALGNNYTESAYRKKYQMFHNGLKTCEKQIFTDDEYLKQIKLERRENEKVKAQIQTEKLEYNRWLREEARDDLIAEKIIAAVRECERPQRPNLIHRSHDQIEACLAFGDEHYGTEFEIKGLYGEILNKYSPDIFEDRMWYLLDEVIEVVKKYNINTLHVYSLGDFTDGILRCGQLMKLRYGVIEGSVRYANFISEWLNILSNECRVKYQMVFGNHSELRILGQPKGTFKDENTGLFVREIIKTKLENNPNFEFIINPTGLIFDNVAGFNLLGIHGEVKNLESAIKDFSNTYKTNIDIMLGGHMHHLKTENVGIGRDIISAPSIIGIDEFSMSLNKTSDPGAVMFFVEQGKGKVGEYTIKV